jgi:hypothetical protein
MNISKDSDSTFKVILTNVERAGIYGCIWQTRGRLSDSECLKRIGVDRKYLISIVDYIAEVRDKGATDYRCLSRTLSLIKISGDEYHLIVSPRDIELIVRCLEAGLQVIPNWEFHILLGVFPDQVRVLLKQFRSIL